MNLRLSFLFHNVSWNKSGVCLFKGLIAVLFIVITTRASGQEATSSWTDLLFDENMKRHLNELEKSEKVEQCRDWLKHAVVSKMVDTDRQAFELLYDFNPIRYDDQDGMSDFEYGEFRYFFLNTNACVMVPYESPLSRNYVAQVADEYRVIKGKPPINISIVEYQLGDEGTMTCRYRDMGTVKGSQVFSLAYGYFEQDVTTKQGLLNFLNTVDDITFVKMSINGAVRLGGRKYENITTKKVNIEDVAVLYQAGDNVREEYLRELTNRNGFRELFAAAKRKTAANFNGKTLFEQLEHQKQQLAKLQTLSWAEQARIRTLDGLTYEQLLKRTRDDVEYFEALLSYPSFVSWYRQNVKIDPETINIGFSLDPAVRYTLLAADLRVLNDEKAFTEWYNKNRLQEMRKAFLEKLSQDSESEKYWRQYDIEHLSKRESSLSTFISGEFAPVTDSLHVGSFLQSEVGISEDSLTELLARNCAEEYFLLKRYAGLMERISDWIAANKGGNDWEKLALFYTVAGYADGSLAFNFARDPEDQEIANYEKIVYKTIVEDVAVLLYEQGYLDTLVTEFDAHLENAINNYRSGKVLPMNGKIDNELFETLLARSALKKYQHEALNLFLHDIRTNRSYQKGRYDGALMGTEVGMTLFYTDLVMKLWAFDYKKSSPGSIPGFFPKTKFQVSLLHEKDQELNPYTRSWLSFLPESAAYFIEGSEIYFSHVATKIFDASSNDLFPGTEVPATYSSQRFSSWWNSNYSRVANYEPEYHRLNQIQKWSHIVNWLKKKEKLSWLSDKTLVKTRDLDFQDWYTTRSDLKVKSEISFLDKKVLGERTECLEIIKSDPFIFYSYDLRSFHFFGGVSLSKATDVTTKLTTRKPILVAGTNLDRKRIILEQVSPFSLRSFFERSLSTTSGKRITLEPSLNNAVVNHSRMRNLSGRGLKVYTNAMERKVSQTSIKQTAGEISLGEVSCYTTPSKAELNLLESDIKRAERAIKNQLDTRIAAKAGSDFEIVLNIEGSNRALCRLKDSDDYLLVERTKIPLGPADAEVPEGTHLRMKGNSNNYLDIRIIGKGEAERIQQTYQYLVVSPGRNYEPSIHLMKVAQPQGQKIRFLQGETSVDVIRTPDQWVIKQETGKNYTEIAEMIRNSDDFLRLQSDDVAGVLFGRKGQRTVFGNQELSQAQLTQIEETAKIFEGEVRAIIFNNRNEIKFINNNVLTIPSQPGQTEMHLLTKMKGKIREDLRYKDLWSKYPFEADDLAALEKINKENYSLSESYYRFKYTNDLQGDALADIYSYSKDYQYVIKDSKSTLPRVETLQTNPKKPLTEYASSVKEIYTNPDITAEAAQASFVENAKPIYEALNAIAANTPSRRVITRGDPVNSQKIYSYFGGNKVRFCADAPENVSESVRNINTEILINFSNSAFFTTTVAEDPAYQSVSGDLRFIKSTGISTTFQLKAHQFLNAMSDTTVQQMYLMLRADDAGLIFADRLMSYPELKYYLGKVSFDKKKDFIYVISNEPEKVELAFAETGKFRFVYSAGYLLKDEGSLHNALDGYKALMEPFTKDEYQITKKKVIKYVKSHPEGSFSKYLHTDGNVTKVNFGKMTSKEWPFIPSIISDHLFGKKKKYQPKSINKLFDTFQDVKIRELPRNEIQFKSKLKAIPNLKCDQGRDLLKYKNHL